jgi:glycerate kinase
MKVVVAPDKFKGSLTAPQASGAIAAGVRRADPSGVIDECPLADGGEGTVAALVAATGGRFETRRVTGPLPEMKVDATFGILGDRRTAVVEMAAASGLALLKEADRDPLNTTTFGTGELLVAAARLGVDRIVLGIGGSATVDGGLGCAQACGLPVILQEGQPVSPTEPLCGPNGAAAVFGPQKGATPQQVAWLDEALRKLAERTGKLAEAKAPGAGAAGGLGFAMLAFFGASLERGAGIVIEATKLRERLEGADLCITGEGRLDSGSLGGKAPVAAARLCRELSVPCVALVGSVGLGAEAVLQEAILKCVSIQASAADAADSIRRAPELLAAAAERIVTEFRERA